MAKQTELVYTEKELAAIEALKNATDEMSLKDLGIASGTIVSIQKKAVKLAGDPNVVNVVSRDVTDECPTCGSKHSYKVYRLA